MRDSLLRGLTDSGSESEYPNLHHIELALKLLTTIGETLDNDGNPHILEKGEAYFQYVVLLSRSNMQITPKLFRIQFCISKQDSLSDKGLVGFKKIRLDSERRKEGNP